MVGSTAIPDDEREIAKHHALDRSALDLVMRQNRPHNRLGLACVLAMLRYLGRPLAEILPHGVLKHLAPQIGVDHRRWDTFLSSMGTGKYAHKDASNEGPALCQDL